MVKKEQTETSVRIENFTVRNDNWEEKTYILFIDDEEEFKVSILSLL